VGSNPGQDRLELKEWHPNSADKTPLQDRANKGCTLGSFWPRSQSKPLLWINIPISMQRISGTLRDPHSFAGKTLLGFKAPGREPLETAK